MTQTILLVEDSGFFRRAMQKSLESEGFIVITAQNGDEAFVQAQGVRPDLVILDMFMPRLNGMTLLRMLKSHAKTCEVPVIVLSGHEDQRDRAIAKQLGAADYCHKGSTRFDDLTATIRRLLSHVHQVPFQPMIAQVRA
jgi:DNA-binding response OmpR family regulator